MHKNDNCEKSSKIRLKLLEENNVILVKCSGFETEIFMPAIIDGRLSIINVVPQRRCRCVSTDFIVAKKSKSFDVTKSQTLSNWNVSSDFSANFSSSTPGQLRNNVTSALPNSSFSQKPAISKALFHDIPNSGTMLNLQNNTQLRDESGNLQSLNQISNKNHQTNVFPENSSTNLAIPIGSLSDMEWPQTSFIGRESPIHNLNEENFPYLNQSSPKLPRWRKVLTPLKTYSRQKHTPTLKSEGSRKNILMNGRHRSTEGLKAAKNVIKFEIKKVPIDEKIRISPKSFKQQFQYKDNTELYRELYQKHKNEENEMTKKTAYELFTTPASQSYFSRKLRNQFQARCNNKSSSTYPKYKRLAKVETIPSEADTR